MLQGLADGDMGACGEAVRDVNSALMRTDRWSMKLLHGRLEALYIRSRVNVRGRCTEELTGQAECGTIHKLCGSAVDVFLDSSTDAK